MKSYRIHTVPDLLRDLVRRGLLEDAYFGDRWFHSRCPFHRTKSGRPFSVNTENGLWVCLSAGCGKKGNILRLLQELKEPTVEIGRIQTVEPETQRKNDIISVLPEWILGAYRRPPTPLLEQGFSAEVLSRFEVGFDERNGRVTFPIRDKYGVLVAVSGRAVFGQEPKYKVYGVSEFGDCLDDGEYRPEPKKHLYTLHADFAEQRAGPLTIVEGYKAALWLRTFDFSWVVATMGTVVTRDQMQLLHQLGGPYRIFFDHDDPGKAATKQLSQQLISSGIVDIVTYPAGKLQPDDFDQHQLERLDLVTPLRFQQELAMAQWAARRKGEEAKTGLPRTKRRASWFRIETGETKKIRILEPPNGVPYGVIVHWFKRERHTCTRSYPQFQNKCVLCYAYEEKLLKPSRDTNLYPKYERLYTILDLNFYHQLDDAKRWASCGSIGRQGCQYCRSRNPEEARRLFGGRSCWSIGDSQFISLDETDSIIGKSCKNCGQQIYPLMLVCAGCRETVFAEEDEINRMEDPQYNAILDKSRIDCPKCGKGQYLDEVLGCAGNCEEPRRLSIYDKVLEVTCSGKELTRRDGTKTTQKEYHFDRSAPVTTPEQDLLALGIENPEEHLELFDFEQLFLPEGINPKDFSPEIYIDKVLDTQARLIEIENPYPSTNRVDSRSVTRRFRS